MLLPSEQVHQAEHEGLLLPHLTMHPYIAGQLMGWSIETLTRVPDFLEIQPLPRGCELGTTTPPTPCPSPHSP